MDPIIIAVRELGIKEFSSGSNPKVEKYYKSCTDTHTTDDVPWCSAFVNWCFQKAGVSTRSKSLSARSWLKFGTKVKTPRTGDVVVMWRGDKDDGVTGHVTFFINTECRPGHILCLGGNQSNGVTVEEYPLSKVLSFQRIY